MVQAILGNQGNQTRRHIGAKSNNPRTRLETCNHDATGVSRLQVEALQMLLEWNRGEFRAAMTRAATAVSECFLEHYTGQQHALF